MGPKIFYPKEQIYVAPPGKMCYTFINKLVVTLDAEWFGSSLI
jgi:hypothetical protein